MKTRPISFLLSAAVIALAAGAGSGARADESAAGPALAQPTATGPKDALDKGMSAEEIVKLVGKPLTVVNLNANELKAEKWTYRHLIEHKVTQEPTTVASEPAFIGVASFANKMMGTRQVTQYSLKHILTYQVTAQLMVNDRLVVAKQWNERQVSFE